MPLSERARIEEVKKNYQNENDMLLSDWEADVGDSNGPFPPNGKDLAFIFRETWLRYFTDVSVSNTAIIETCDKYLSDSMSFQDAKEKIINDEHHKGTMKAFFKAGHGYKSKYIDSVRILLWHELEFARGLEHFLENGEVPNGWPRARPNLAEGEPTQAK